MTGQRFGWVVLAILLAGSMSTVSGMQGSSDETRSSIDSNPGDSFKLDSLDPERSDRMTRAFETESFDTQDIIATSGWVESAHITDWLGPLAPVALSPFFGITCLSGLALWGPNWITDNAVLSANGPLKNPMLFYAFLGLTILTSVPRFTKISKPFAQAVDRLETYSVIVILLMVKVISSMNTDDSGATPVAMVQPGVVQLGVVSFSVDTLLAIAMVVNVLVINSVKFFFEFLVWLTPVPFLDACFEVLSKSLCAGLMAIYAFSPAIATSINLLLLLVAAVVLRWMSRRVRFYRTMVLDPILARCWQDYGIPKRPELIVFPKQRFGPFAAKSRLKLVRQSDGDGWVLSEANWWRRQQSHVVIPKSLPKMCCGWVMHQIEISNAAGESCILCLSRRYDAHLPTLAQDLKLCFNEESTAVKGDRCQFTGEFT
jgi:hypothetical protein